MCRLRYLERLLGRLQEAKVIMKARQDEIRGALFKIMMAGAKVAKKITYHRYLKEENDAGNCRMALLDNELSNRAGAQSPIFMIG